MVDKNNSEQEQNYGKTIKVSDETYERVVKWADVQHRTIGGQVEAMLEVYEGKRKPKN